jgi:hypothetical protein
MKNRVTTYVRYSRIGLFITRFMTHIMLSLPVSAQVPQYMFTGPVNPVSSPTPLNSTSNKVQWLYLPTDLVPTLPTGRINGIYLRSADDYPTSAFPNLLIRMGHTTLNSFTPTTAAFVSTGMDTVMYSDRVYVPELSRGEWIPFPVHKPFVYDGSRNIVLEVSTSGTSSDLRAIQYGNTANRRRYGTVYATSGTAANGPAVLGFDFAGPNDAGVILITEPVAVCPYVVRAKLVNFGTNRLNQVRIHWELDGVLQPSILWTMPVDTFGSAAGNTVTVTLGTIPFTAGGSRHIKAWTDRPNGVADPVGYNDTSLALYTALPGIAPGQITDTVPGSHCGPGPVELRASGTGTVLRWYDTIAGGTPLGVGAIFTTPSIAATTVFYVSAGNSVGCESARIPVTATIRTPPLITVDPKGPVDACTGDTVSLYATSGVGFSYQWHRDQVLIPGASYSVFNAQLPGTYTVQATDENTGCSGLSLPVTVRLHARPEPTVYFDGTVLSTDLFVTYQWSRDGWLIPGANHRTCAVSGDGYYTVIVRNGVGCSGTSTAYPVGVSKIVSPDGLSPLEIYPNPAVSWVYLHLPAAAMVSFSGVEGKVMLQAAIQDPHEPIDISALPAGLYIVRAVDRIGRPCGIGKMIKIASIY